MRVAPALPSPVLSLTVVDPASLEGGRLVPSSRVLVAVRDEQANRHHPNVVSVPTQRIPQEVHDAIVGAAEVVAEHGVLDARHYRGARFDSVVDDGHAPTLYATESLLAGKLGLAEQLEREEVAVSAELVTKVRGTAVYDDVGGGDMCELISMLNVVVQIAGVSDHLPERTSSYSWLGWVPVNAFLEGVETRDAAIISPELDPIELCVHGVCLTAAALTLRHLVGHPVPTESVRTS